MALDRDTVVTTAIRLINEGGLESLTLRKLAAELGVQAPALYWHVRSKRELLDLIAIELMARQQTQRPDEPAPGQEWWDWQRDRVRIMRDGMLAQRDSAMIAAGNRPIVENLPHVEDALARLSSIAGLTPLEALMFVLATGNYTVGNVLETQQSAKREDDDDVVARAVFAEMLDAEHFPTLAAAAAAIAGITDPEVHEAVRAGLSAEPGGPDAVDLTKEAEAGVRSMDDAVFEFGLDLMLEGLRARIARRASELPSQ
jgi:TetR/AcrR family tetracycline transcriptional repressor